MEWFSEHCSMWKGMALSVEYEKILFEQHSQFQYIQIFQTTTYGNMLVLDNKIQCTERDEFAYHEMLVHPALFSHPNPQRVLVIGGGDGGAVREICKHKEVQLIDLCEIDPIVTQCSRIFLSHISSALNDPRVHIYHEDGIQFIKQIQYSYDIIIIDSSDPFGPAEALYESPFYQLVAQHLSPNGIVAAQSAHFFIHQETVHLLAQSLQQNFAHYAYLFAHVPSYPGGGVGIALASNTAQNQLTHPIRKIPNGDLQQLQYYTPEMHYAASVLPALALSKN